MFDALKWIHTFMRVVYRFTLCKELLRSKDSRKSCKNCVTFSSVFRCGKNSIFQRKKNTAQSSISLFEVTVVVRDLLLEPKMCVYIMKKKKHASHNKSYDDSVSNQRIKFTIHIQLGTSIFPVITQLRNETYSHHKKHT